MGPGVRRDDDYADQGSASAALFALADTGASPITSTSARSASFTPWPVTADELKKQKDRLKRAAKKTPLLISAVTGEGMPDALRALVEVIGEAPVSLKAKGGAALAEPWTPATPPQS